MRPKALRRRLILAGFGGVLAAATITTGVAKADGELSNAEAAYVIAFGGTAICPVIAQFPSEAGVLGIAQGVMEDGFPPDSSVDIINASVAAYCPQWFPLLQRIGARARGEIHT
jgi:hypothetical protein